MNENFIKLYAATVPADSVYFLDDGSVYFYASNADKYAISGKNLIIGSTEIIMSRLLGIETDRLETAVASAGSSLKKIPIDKFLAGLKTYSFALNASMVLAKQVYLTGEILQKNMRALEGDEKKVREMAITYYIIVTRLKQEYDKRRIPWIKSLAEEFEDTLIYKKGEALHRSTEPVHMANSAQLSDKDVEFQRGTIICEENTPGSEMYILRSGSLDVIVKGVRISTIDEPGTIIGESSLLLGQKRAATMIAKNTVIMTRIRKEDLKDVAEKQADFLCGIASTLAKRHYYNLTRIEHVNKMLAEQSIDREIAGGGDKSVFIIKRASHDLNQLKEKIEDTVREKKADFFQDLVSTF
jgi:CRP-like cAMP-binding protein